jgi:hypothetical protein
MSFRTWSSASVPCWRILANRAEVFTSVSIVPMPLAGYGEAPALLRPLCFSSISIRRR